jgi:hypothetical protein
MPDTKITALTAIGANPIIPSTFPIPMVDLTDTSMAASGTTKKVTVNQILGAGGTATLASATITGDLTVDTNVLKVDTTNNRVGILTATPADTLDVNGRVTALRYLSSSSNAALPSFAVSAGNGAYNSGTNEIGFSINSTSAMTLNSTGLGIGTTAAQKLTVLTNIGISASTATAADDRLVFSENMGSVNLGSQIVWQNSSFSTPYASIGVSNGAAGSDGTLIFSTCSSIFTNTNTERVRIKPTGQVRFFPLAADPAGAEAGDVYYNSSSNKLKCYNGSTWNDLF